MNMFAISSPIHVVDHVVDHVDVIPNQVVYHPHQSVIVCILMHVHDDGHAYFLCECLNMCIDMYAISIIAVLTLTIVYTLYRPYTDLYHPHTRPTPTYTNTHLHPPPPLH